MLLLLRKPKQGAALAALAAAIRLPGTSNPKNSRSSSSGAAATGAHPTPGLSYAGQDPKLQSRKAMQGPGSKPGPVSDAKQHQSPETCQHNGGRLTQAQKVLDKLVPHSAERRAPLPLQAGLPNFTAIQPRTWSKIWRRTCDDIMETYLETGQWTEQKPPCIPLGKRAEAHVMSEEQRCCLQPPVQLCAAFPGLTAQLPWQIIRYMSCTRLSVYRYKSKDVRCMFDMWGL